MWNGVRDLETTGRGYPPARNHMSGLCLTALQ